MNYVVITFNKHMQNHKLQNSVIPTKRSAWRDLRTNFRAKNVQMRRSLDSARDDKLSAFCVFSILLTKGDNHNELFS